MFFMSLEDNKDKQVKLDDSLMERVAANDAAAFGSLYELSKYAVYCLLLSIVRNHDLAEDLMQDTYLSVKKSIANYVPQNKPLAWIFAIAKNLAYMELRKSKKEAPDDISQYELSDTGEGTDTALDRLVLKNALSLLKEQERQIVLLHAVAGMKFREIAANFGLSVGTVLSSYSRSLKKLRKSMEQEVRGK